MTTTHEFETRY